MYEQVLNVTFPSSGIHTLVFKWYMTRVPDGMPLQEYPPNVNIPTTNANKFFLQTYINQAITVGYIFPHSNHQRQVLLQVVEGQKIGNTNNIKPLVCLSFKLYVYLPEER